jgi:hypothetical protein
VPAAGRRRSADRRTHTTARRLFAREQAPETLTQLIRVGRDRLVQLGVADRLTNREPCRRHGRHQAGLLPEALLARGQVDERQTLRAIVTVACTRRTESARIGSPSARWCTGCKWARSMVRRHVTRELSRMFATLRGMRWSVQCS